MENETDKNELTLTGNHSLLFKPTSTKTGKVIMRIMLPWLQSTSIMEINVTLVAGVKSL